MNIARGFVHPYSVLLLDEPTASLDAANRAVVLALIHEAKARGAATEGTAVRAACRASSHGTNDCSDDLVMPGLTELPTDSLERHIEPRPKLHWPHAAAITAHDGELALTGITTVFDALRISHFLHPRAKICSATLIDEMARFGPDDRVGIVSLVDHTPGERQSRDQGKLRAHVCGKQGLKRPSLTPM